MAQIPEENFSFYARPQGADVRITKTEEQGLRIMVRLARSADQLTVADLSREEGLPEPTVGKLLSKLAHSSLVRSVRGRGGGYSLARPASAVSVADVLDALGEPVLGGNLCMDRDSGEGSCPQSSVCGLRPVWGYLEEAIAVLFHRTTLSDLMGAQRGIRERLEASWSPPAAAPERGTATSAEPA